MKQLIGAFFLAGVFAGSAASADTLAITHVNIVDATGALTQPEMTVVVRDGRIAELGRSAVVAVPRRCQNGGRLGQVLNSGSLGYARSHGIWRLVASR